MTKKDLLIANLFGVSLFSKPKNDLLKMIDNHILKKNKSSLLWINTPNAEQIVMTTRDDVFKSILNSSNIRIPDGMSLVWSSQVLKYFGKIEMALKKRITGVDLMADICELAARGKKNVFLLGGMNSASGLAAEKLKERYVGLQVDHSIGFERVTDATREENDKVLEMIKNFQTDVLFVGFGAPRQEKWVLENRNILEKMGVRVVMVVGGAYDMISGSLRRSPRWLQSMGMEWFWRLLQEPRRWRRQLSLFTYWGLVGKELMRRK